VHGERAMWVKRPRPAPCDATSTKRWSRCVVLEELVITLRENKNDREAMGISPGLRDTTHRYPIAWSGKPARLSHRNS
jgi:hypothetical protein